MRRRGIRKIPPLLRPLSGSELNIGSLQHRPGNTRGGFLYCMSAKFPKPCTHFSWVPPGASFLSRQERRKECDLREALSAKPPSLRNPFRPQNQSSLSAAFRRVRGAAPKFFRFSSMKETNILDAFYFRIPSSGYSMPVCALARNRKPVLVFVDCFHCVKTVKRPD